MRDSLDLRWRAEENLREAFRFLARGSVEGATLEVDGACHVATGLPNAFFNPVFLYRAPDDVEGFQRRARAFFEARGGLPWSLVVMREQDAAPHITEERLRDAGMVPAGIVPLLVRATPREAEWPRFHPEILIERVEDWDTLSDHREALAESFGLPAYVTDLLIPNMPPPPLRLYVAYLAGEPIGTAAVFEGAGVAGIYNLGVHPLYRRRGIGAALIRHALDEACWECGLSECTAQVPRAVLPLFRRLGFHTMALCARYAEPQHLPPGEGKKRG